MGRDKALLTLESRTFIERLIKELSICREVFISTCKDRDYSEYGLEVLVDEIPDIGPIEGIRQALKHAGTDHVFICACDMPFVTEETVRYLAGYVSPQYDAVVFQHEGRIHPLCGIYSKAVLPAADQLIMDGRYRLTGLLSSVRTKYVDLGATSFDEKMLKNANTPEEYRGILNARSPL
jgi:molybdopterin-guanine dinucleotide biosynthesis protein A